MSSVDLTNELRLAKPRAPEQLRERVLALSERPVREPRFSFSLPSRHTVRRVAFVAAPAVVAVALGGAAIHGIANSGTPNQHQAARVEADQPTRTTTTETFGDGCSQECSKEERHWRTGTDWPFQDVCPVCPAGPSTECEPSSALPGVANRPGRRARCALALDAEGDADRARPRRLRRIRHVQRREGRRVGARLQDPVGHVQQAIARFSALGAIAAQNIQITDLQAQFSQLVKRIGALRVAIAKVDDRLADTSLSNEERVRLEQRRARLASGLEALKTSKARTSHRAALATVSLGLTTKEAAAVVKPEHQGPLGRALHDAGKILAKEASWALYALIVLGPILLVALARVAACSGRPSPLRPAPA